MGFGFVAYLDVAINIILEWKLAKVDQDVIAWLLQSHSWIKPALDVFEVDIVEGNSCRDHVSVCFRRKKDASRETRRKRPRISL